MRVHGISLTIDDRAQTELFVYFVPLTYADWVKYFDAGTSDRFDPPVIRYVFGTYVTSAFYRTADGDSDVTALQLSELPPSITTKIISSIADKSGFTDGDAYSALIESLELKTRTLIGSYDYFLYLYLGTDGYLSALNMDALTRAQLITMVEKSTGISVSKRFKDSIELNMPLDLINQVAKYEGNIRAKERSGQLHRPRRDMSVPDGAHPSEKTSESTSVEAMVASAKQALDAEFSLSRRGTRKQYFDWNSDQYAVDSASASEDAAIFNIERQPQPKPPRR